MSWKPLEVPHYAHPEEETRPLLDWVRGQGPEEWHGVVASMNWGTGYEHVVDWICAQPSCHKATALIAFWRTLPEDWIAPPDPVQSLARTREFRPMFYNLGMNILGYWRRGTYLDHIALRKNDRHDFAFQRKLYERHVAALPPGVAPPFELPQDFDCRGAEIEVDMLYFCEGNPAPLVPRMFQNMSQSETVRAAPELSYREFQRLHTVELEKAALRKNS